MYLAAKRLTSFKHLKRVSVFPLRKRQLSYKILNEIRIAIASVVELVDLDSNLKIIILPFRTLPTSPQSNF